ncbi:MAG: hypothetical protein JO264_04525 [Acidisphaera sp.]|nr:hypothetical protein [Acidisphaera sp.]
MQRAIGRRETVNSQHRTQSVHPLDPWRVANLLITGHGDQAINEAARRRIELWAIGDEAGAAVWTRVLDAILELRRGHLKAGEHAH